MRRLVRTAPIIGLTASLTLVTLGVAASAGAAPPRSVHPRTDTVNVVGYSVVSNVYTALEKAFQKTAAGRNVTFTNSFGASTTQANDVVEGQPADVVNFSTVPDMQLLVDNGIVSSKWNTTGSGKAEGGFVSDSVVVFVTRPHNPLKIGNWPTLAGKSVQIVTPDPISSGSARWNLLEAYENQIKLGKSASAAYTFANSIVKRVVAEPSSGGKALTTFLAGTGNVLLAYESDAEQALKSAEPIQIVYPTQNVLIQTPAALTSTGSKNAGAKAFFTYLFSPAGQNLWAHNGFRPTLSSVAKSDAKLFPHVYKSSQLTTIGQLGGWPKVIAKFFSTNGIITQIEKANGWTS